MATDFGLHVPGYNILEELSTAATVCMLKVQGPDKKFKLWKCYDLQNGGQAVETKHLGLLRKLHHQYLNAVTNFFHIEDQEVLVVESDLPSMTLRDRLEECKATNGTGIPPEELIQYMEQAAEVIDFLTNPQHDFQGKKIAIFHRSLRPDCLHIFDDRAKRVCKVADFGLAKPVTEIDESVRHSLGLTNYEYSPPEFDEGHTTATSDQYSLAVCYYELRTGALPFQGSMLQRLQAQLAGTPTLDLVPEEEQAVIKKALAREPKQRYSSCKEFVKQLKAVLPKNTGMSSLPLMRSAAMISALEPIVEPKPLSDPKVPPLYSPASNPRASLLKPDLSPPANNPRASLPRLSAAQMQLGGGASPSPATPTPQPAFRSMAPIPDLSEQQFQDLPEPEIEPMVIQHDPAGHDSLGTKAQSLRQSMNLKQGSGTPWIAWLVILTLAAVALVGFYFLINTLMPRK
jgi:serine/threonine protein kinase